MNHHPAVKKLPFTKKDIKFKITYGVFIVFFIPILGSLRLWIVQNLPKPNPQQLRQELNEIFYNFESDIKSTSVPKATFIETINTKGFKHK